MPTEKAQSKLVADYIKKVAADSPENRLTLIDNSTIFDEPLVAFADGDDPLFTEYKTIIGQFHMTPREVFESATGKKPAKLSVISWILPITERTRASMRMQTHYPTLRWSHSRYHGEHFNESLRTQVVNFVQSQGYAAVAPFLSRFFHRLTLANGRTSNWSERHVAYAAGLGTFSLSDGFITPKGIAIRCGSVVTNMKLPASLRKHKVHTENCAFLANGSCGECIDRCPAGAITARGHDKNLCFQYMHTELVPLLKRYGVEIAGCGFCQTRVPCESGIPTGLLKK
ncbi:MAG: epoxyqueuosine reductase [Chloroflexota bacterium]